MFSSRPLLHSSSPSVNTTTGGLEVIKLICHHPQLSLLSLGSWKHNVSIQNSEKWTQWKDYSNTLIFDILQIDIRNKMCLFAASCCEENDSVERCGVWGGRQGTKVLLFLHNNVHHVSSGIFFSVKMVFKCWKTAVIIKLMVQHRFLHN